MCFSLSVKVEVGMDVTNKWSNWTGLYNIGFEHKKYEFDVITFAQCKVHNLLF